MMTFRAQIPPGAQIYEYPQSREEDGERKMQNKQKRTQGFTLIELVVATLIIGLLAAVLIPNALGARARANNSAVQTFLKNFAQEMEIEYADGGYYFPGAYDDTEGVYQGDEVYYGVASFVNRFLTLNDGDATAGPGGDDTFTDTGTKAAFDDAFEIAMPENISMVIKTNVPDAYSGYCVVARWNSQDTENYHTYILTPNEGVQVLQGVHDSAVGHCPIFDGSGETVADATP